MAAPSNLKPNLTGASLDPNTTGGTTLPGGGLPADVAQAQQDAAGLPPPGAQGQQPGQGGDNGQPFNYAAPAEPAKKKEAGKEGEAKDPYSANEAVQFLRQVEAQNQLANALTLQDRDKALRTLNRTKRLAGIGFRWMLAQAKQAAAAGVQMAMRVGAERAAMMGHGQDQFMAANLAGRLMAQANDNVNSFQAQLATRASEFGLRIAEGQARIYENTQRKTMDASQAIGIAGIIAKGAADAEALAALRGGNKPAPFRAIVNGPFPRPELNERVPSSPMAPLNEEQRKKQPVPARPPGQFAPGNVPGVIGGEAPRPIDQNNFQPPTASTDEWSRRYEIGTTQPSPAPPAAEGVAAVPPPAMGAPPLTSAATVAPEPAATEESASTFIKSDEGRSRIAQLSRSTQETVDRALRRNPKMTKRELQELITEEMTKEAQIEAAFATRLKGGN